MEQTIAVAKSVKVPVILVGGVRGCDEIEKILEKTPIQYVSMARPFVSHPDLINKWK